MKNLLLSAAIGDIAGMPYEFKGRTKDYNAVNLLLPTNTYTDDTVCTFACAEALLRNLNMAENLWNRCRQDGLQQKKSNRPTILTAMVAA